MALNILPPRGVVGVVLLLALIGDLAAQQTPAAGTCSVQPNTDVATGTADNIDLLPLGVAAYSVAECCEVCQAYAQCIAGVFNTETNDWCWAVKSFSGYEVDGTRTVVEKTHNSIKISTRTRDTLNAEAPGIELVLFASGSDEEHTPIRLGPFANGGTTCTTIGSIPNRFLGLEKFRLQIIGSDGWAMDSISLETDISIYTVGTNLWFDAFGQDFPYDAPLVESYTWSSEYCANLEEKLGGRCAESDELNGFTLVAKYRLPCAHHPLFPRGPATDFLAYEGASFGYSDDQVLYYDRANAAINACILARYGNAPDEIPFAPNNSSSLSTPFSVFRQPTWYFDCEPGECSKCLNSAPLTVSNGDTFNWSERFNKGNTCEGTGNENTDKPTTWLQCVFD